MSDKKQAEQKKPNGDITTSSHSAENPTDLSASIDISSPPVSPSSEASSTEKSSTKNSTSTSKTQSSTKSKPDKSTTTVKDKASIAPTATSAKKSPLNTKTSNNQKSKISKMALIAFFIALLALAASAGHYYWNEQQKVQFSQQLSDKFQLQLQQELKQGQSQVTEQLQQQTQQNNAQVKAVVATVEKNAASQIAKFEQQIALLTEQMANLRQDQPSDWLLQEAEYLIRIAARSLWLEQDTRTALSLLNDADLRIQELNDPQFLTLRQTIQQDIAKLQLLPTLETDDVILKLMALAQQTNQLPLKSANMPKGNDSATDLELTDNISDWQENLAKTWRKFIADFITINRKTADAEPLMSPQFQQNLRENLNLKLQTAIWAANQANSEIYRKALNDVQNWVKDYFDVTDQANQNFSNVISTLKMATVEVNYPNNISALKVIRQLLSDNKKPVAAMSKQEKNTEVTTQPIVKPVVKPIPESTTELESTEQEGGA